MFPADRQLPGCARIGGYRIATRSAGLVVHSVRVLRARDSASMSLLRPHLIPIRRSATVRTKAAVWCPRRGVSRGANLNAVVSDRVDGGADRWRSTGQLIGPRKLDQRRWPQLDARRHRPPPSRGSESASAFRLSRGRSGGRCFTWIMRCDSPEPPKKVARRATGLLDCTVRTERLRRGFQSVARLSAQTASSPPISPRSREHRPSDTSTGAISARPPDALITSEEHSARCCRM